MVYFHFDLIITLESSWHGKKMHLIFSLMSLANSFFFLLLGVTFHWMWNFGRKVSGSFMLLLTY